MGQPKSKKPAVSIIILNYNAANFLTETLNSVMMQRGISFETIVVDNHSFDNSKQVVTNNFPQVTWLQLPDNRGFSTGNNRGIALARADTILFLNPDASFTKEDDLKVCYDRLWSDLSIGCLTGRVNLALSREIDETCHRGFPTPWAGFTHFSGLSKLFPNVPILNHYTKRYLGYDTEHEIDAVGGMFLLIRREVGDKVGWWDENYPLYGEDLDFCYRVKEAGYHNLYYPKVTILHYKGITTGMNKKSKYIATASDITTKKVKLWSVQAMERFYDKHYQQKYPPLITHLVHLGIKLMYLKRVKFA